MHFIRRLVLLALVSATVSPLTLMAQEASVARARAEVIEANGKELAAVIRGDAATAAAFFVEDGTLLPPDGSRVVGRSAIEAFWTPQPGTRIIGADTEVHRFDVRGDLAFLVGGYELEVETGGAPRRQAPGNSS